MDTGINLEEEALDDLEIEALSNGLDFERPLPEGIEIIEEDDGGVTLDFEPRREGAGGFYDNLAEELEDRELGSISSELSGEYDSNKASRYDWEEAYSKGLELLGFNYEERTEPFRGATGVTIPCWPRQQCSFRRKRSMKCYRRAVRYGPLFSARGPMPKKSRPNASVNL